MPSDKGSMKKVIRTLNKAFISILLITFTSCNGQTQPQILTELPNKTDTQMVGEANISLPNGVSTHTMFRCSIKDKDGNLWFGTTGARIYKYDGKEFTRYAEQEGPETKTSYSKNGLVYIYRRVGIAAGNRQKNTTPQ